MYTYIYMYMCIYVYIFMYVSIPKTANIFFQNMPFGKKVHISGRVMKINSSITTELLTPYVC